MEQHEENAPFKNEYIKLNELCKFAQRGETNDILQDISYTKEKKIINQYARERNSKYDKTNFRYNTLFNKNRNYKNNDNNEFNNIYIDNNKNDENEKMFTRINTNMNNNKIVNSRNQGNIDRDDDDNKIYDSYTKLPQNSAKRFIQKENITQDGECAEKYKLYYKEELEKYEEQFDGLYALCTPDNMTGSVEEILQISKGRWEIEESFRIMKSEFKARPVYLQLEERIKAHFTICYLSLLIYRILF